MPEVEFVNVTKRYGKKKVLENISFKVEDGEYAVLCGPTGSGKTTTLFLAAGILKPDEGEIYIGGELVNSVPPEDRNLALMFDVFALFPHLNVIENVIYGLIARGVPLEDAIKSGEEILDMMFLSGWEKAYPHELSGGMKQRVALARAIASGARLILLDEPLSALDAKIALELSYELRRIIKDLKITAIHATHNVREAMMMADKMIILRDGKILQVGTPEEIYKNPSNLFVASYVSDPNFLVGTLVRKEGRCCVVKLENGVEICTKMEEMEPEKRVVVCVKTEDMEISKKDLNLRNSLEGIVRDVLFVGEFTRFEVEVEGLKGNIVVRKSGKYINDFKLGDHVRVWFEPDHAKLFLYPEEGLRKAISIE
ncbi:MAG: ABC transporter ATP-binding protein [Candidatus Asgardarchaeia archaeon]